MDGHPAVVAGHGDHRVVLDVQLLLVAHPVLALDHQGRAGQRRFDVAGLDLEMGEDLAAQQRIEDRLERLGAQRHVGDRLAQERPVGRRDEGDRLGVVADLVDGQDRLVVLDRVDDVRAGNVGGRDDHDPRPVERRIELHADQPGARLGRADRLAVPRAGKDQVVGVQGRPGQLGRTLAPERRAVDRGPGPQPQSHGRRSILGPC